MRTFATAMQYHHVIHFMLAEAQAMLPQVIATLTEIRDLKHELDERGYDIRGHRYFTSLGTNGTAAYPPNVDKIIQLHQGLISQGVQVKDIEIGLVDFPTLRRNGEEVYLCFKLGEESIEYWHSIEDGFPGRQALDTL
ncbi:MAG: DUF2203 domain-containing protein [bacterium]|nr:DUF2203 domain-containing protein [Candidatus Kapabacteria bacterium]